MKTIFNITLSIIFLATSTHLWSDDIELSSKTKKYLSILIKKPKSGILFDKFYQSWLETATSDELEEYLKKKATGSIEYQLLLAYFYETTGNDAKALTALNTILKTSRNNPGIFYTRAKLELLTLDFKNAIADLQQALELKPDDYLKLKILKLLGRAQMRNQQKNQALKTWNSIADSFTDEDIGEDILELQISEGLFEESLKTCKKLIDQSTLPFKTIQLSLRMGDIYQRMGKKEEALEAYSSTLSKVGKDSWLEKEILAQISKVFRFDGDLTGLVDYLKKLDEKFDQRISIKRKTCHLLMENGQHDEALNLYRTILKLTPGERSNREEYIELLKKAEKTKEALLHIEDLLAKYPDDSELYIQAATLNHKTGDSKKSEDILNKYVTQSDQSEFVFLRVSRLFENFENMEAAEKTLRTMIEKHPDSLGAKETLATYLYKHDDKEEAKKWFKSMVTDEVNQETMLRVLNALASRSEQATALEVLTSHMNKFKTSFLIMKKYTEIQRDLKKYEPALDTAMQLIVLAKTPAELQQSNALIIQISHKASQTETLLKKYEEADSRSEKEVCLLSALYLKSGDFAMARKVIDEATKTIPHSIFLLSQSVQLAVQQYDWDDAIDKTVALLKAEPHRKTIYIKDLIKFESKKENHDAVEKWIGEWKKNSPGSTEPYFKEVIMHEHKGDLLKAIDVLKSAAIKFPEDKPLLNRLASFHEAEGQFEDASRIYWRLISMDKDFNDKMSTTHSLIRTHINADTSEKLIRIFEARIKSNPKSIYPVLALSSIYQQLGNYEERRRYLLKASEMKGNDINLLHEIARIETEEGEYEKAMDTLKRADKIDKTKNTKYKIANLLSVRGDQEKANQLLLDLSLGDNLDEGQCLRISEKLILNGEIKQAIELLNKAIHQLPKSYRLKFMRAIAYEEEDRIEESLAEFIQLLTIKEEFTPKGFNKNLNVNNPYSPRNYYKNYPDAIIDIFSSQNLKHSIYTYKRNNPRSNYYRGYGSSRFGKNIIALPKKVDDLNHYAIGHLSHLIGLLEEDRIKEVIEEIEQTGIPYARLKLTMKNQSLANMDFWEEMEKHYPKDDHITLLKSIYLTYQGLDANQIVQYFNTLKEKFPLLSANNILVAFSKYNLEEKTVIEAIELLMKQEELDATSAQFVYGFVRRKPDVSQTLQSKLNALMLKLYKNLKSKNAQRNNWVIQQILTVLSMEENLDDFFRIIEYEIQNVKEAKHVKGAAYAYRGRYSTYSNNKLFNMPRFPPTTIENFPTSVVAIFNKDTRYNTGLKLSTEKIEQHIKKVKNPILKILMSHAVGDDEKTDQLVSDYAKSEKNTLNSFIMQVTWNCYREKYKEAISLLQKARLLPLSLSLRKSIDCQIVACAFNCLESEESVEAAKKAALRLKSIRLTTNEKNDLLLAFETLGMEKEADKMDSKINSNSQPSYTSSRNPYYGGGNSQSEKNKIKDLFKKDKHDLAIKMMARSFRNFVKSYLPYKGMAYQNIYNINFVKDIIKSEECEQEFIQELRPKNGKMSLNHYLELGLMHELLEQRELAFQNYVKALELRPKHEGALVKVTFFEFSVDPDKARERIMKVLNKHNLSNFVRNISQNLYNEKSIENKINIGHFILAVMKKFIDSPDHHFQWYANFIRNYSRNLYESPLKVINIHDKSYDKNFKKLKKESQKLTQKRNELLLKILKMGLKNRACADFSFQFIESCNTVFSFSDEDLFEMSEFAIYSMTNTKNRQSHYNITNYSSANAKESTPPLLYFITYAKKNKLEDKIETFSRSLKSSKHKNILKKTQLLNRLFDASGDEFLTVSKEYLKPSTENIYGITQQNPSVIIQVWSLAHKKVPLDDILLKDIKKKINMNSYWNVNYIHSYIEELISRQQYDSAYTFLKNTAALYFPENSNKSKLLNNQLNDALQKFQAFMTIINPLLKNEMGYFMSLRVIPVEFFKSDNYGYLNNFSYPLEKLKITDASIPYWPYCGNFDSYYPYHFDNRNTNLFSRFIEIIKKDDSQKEKIIETLSAIKSKTQGVQLVLDLLNNKSQQAILKALYKDFENIKSMPSAQQKNFFKTIKPAFPEKKSRVLSALKGDGLKFKQYMNQAILTMADDEISNFKKIDVQTMGEHSYGKKAANILISLIKQDQDEAEKLLTHVLRKMRINFRAYRYRRNGIVFKTHKFNILENIANQDKSLDAAIFVHRILAKSDDEIIPFIPYGVEHSFSNHLKNNLKTENKKNLVKNAVALISECDKKIKGHTVYLSLLDSFFNKFNKNQKDQLAEALGKLESKSNFVNELQVRLQYAILKADKNHHLPKEWIEHFTKQIENEKLAKGFRLFIGFNLFGLHKHAENVQELAPSLLKLTFSTRDVVFEVNTLSRTFDDILNQYLKIEPRNEEWKSLAESILSLWKKNQRKLTQNSHHMAQASIIDLLKYTGRESEIASFMSNSLSQFRRLRSDRLGYYNYRKKAAAFINDLIHLETNQEDEIFTHALKKMDAVYKKSNYSHKSYRFDSSRYYLLNEMGKQSADLSIYKFCVRNLISNSNDFVPYFPTNLINSPLRELQKEYTSNLKKFKKENKHYANVASALESIKSLSKGVGDLKILVINTHLFFKKLNKAEKKQLFNLMNEEKDSSFCFQSLKNNLEFYILLDEDQNTLPENWIQHYHKLLRDDSLPLHYRLSVGLEKFNSVKSTTNHHDLAPEFIRCIIENGKKAMQIKEVLEILPELMKSYTQVELNDERNRNLSRLCDLISSINWNPFKKDDHQNLIKINLMTILNTLNKTSHHELKNKLHSSLIKQFKNLKTGQVIKDQYINASTFILATLILQKSDQLDEITAYIFDKYNNMNQSKLENVTESPVYRLMEMLLKSYPEAEVIEAIIKISNTHALEPISRSLPIQPQDYFKVMKKENSLWLAKHIEHNLLDLESKKLLSFTDKKKCSFCLKSHRQRSTIDLDLVKNINLNLFQEIVNKMESEDKKQLALSFFSQFKRELEEETIQSVLNHNFENEDLKGKCLDILIAENNMNSFPQQLKDFFKKENFSEIIKKSDHDFKLARRKAYFKFLLSQNNWSDLQTEIKLIHETKGKIKNISLLRNFYHDYLKILEEHVHKNMSGLIHNPEALAGLAKVSRSLLDVPLSPDKYQKHKHFYIWLVVSLFQNSEMNLTVEVRQIFKNNIKKLKFKEFTKKIIEQMNFLSDGKAGTLSEKHFFSAMRKLAMDRDLQKIFSIEIEIDQLEKMKWFQAHPGSFDKFKSQLSENDVSVELKKAG